ncbi:hypothetical protein [Candidatus Poriferisocius sp.]|uniref:hypothetical protein n=1 Tax=Candidatus Poriferisocius sp. TaxID=3101276 RepID=UPI003B5C983F
MKKRDDLPDVGLVAWYVGAGDSLTLLTGQERDGAELIVQVDLNHMSLGEDDQEPHVPVIRQLVEILPVVDERPYLAAFVLTHPDQDHCRGFRQLLEEEKVLIGELWMTPRIFEEYQSELCDDAIAFREEADRRLAAIKVGASGSGNRLRVVGRDDLFELSDLQVLPYDARSSIGSVTTFLDGWDLEGSFEAGFHGLPDVGEDVDRNDTSLVMRVTMSAGDCAQRVLFLGDLAHDRLGSILGGSESDELEFDVLIAPHHCSKRALFDDDGNEAGAVISGLTANAADGAWMVASAPPIPSSDTDGADPPHRVAWDKYSEIFGVDHQVCTGEHGSEINPDPVVFGVGHESSGYLKPSTDAAIGASALIGAAAAARSRPRPTDRRGYGIATQ